MTGTVLLLPVCVCKNKYVFICVCINRYVCMFVSVFAFLCVLCVYVFVSVWYESLNWNNSSCPAGLLFLVPLVCVRACVSVRACVCV